MPKCDLRNLPSPPLGCLLPYFGPESGEGLGLRCVSVGYSGIQGWQSCPQSHRVCMCGPVVGQAALEPWPLSPAPVVQTSRPSRAGYRTGWAEGRPSKPCLVTRLLGPSSHSGCGDSCPQLVRWAAQCSAPHGSEVSRSALLEHLGPLVHGPELLGLA